MAFRRRVVSLGLLSVALIALTVAWLAWRQPGADATFFATVQRGTLVTQLTLTGVLRPVQSLTYRSPLGSRDAEVVFLAAEGSHVNQGELLVQLDSADLQHELDRVVQERRQIQVELQLAEIEWQAGRAAIDALANGEGAIGMNEAQSRVRMSQRRVDRLRAELTTLTPMLEKGFITREELNRTVDALEQAEAEVALDRQRAQVLVEQTRPRDAQRAELQLAQKAAQRDNIRARLDETAARATQLQTQIDACRLLARQPGLVVHEEFLAATPRRKIRIGDHVTGSQGLVTIPEVNSMLVEASASEADIHRLHPGQRAAISLEAFPGVGLTGSVTRVGVLARGDASGGTNDKRFDIIVAVDATQTDLKPDMTSRVDIQLGERQGVLLVPVTAVFERDGRAVCLVAGRLGAETRPVELGDSNTRLVEVIKGLAEGERVLLTSPAAPGGEARSVATTSEPGLKRDLIREPGRK